MVRSRKTSGRNPLRNKLLTLEERRIIDQSLGQGLKVAVIARMLDRSFYSVSTYKRKGANYGQKKPTGRPPLLGARIRRHIQRLISNKFYTLKEIKAFLLSNGISDVSLMTVSRCVRELEFIKRRKMMATLNLDAEHRAARRKWVRERLNKGTD